MSLTKASVREPARNGRVLRSAESQSHRALHLHSTFPPSTSKPTTPGPGSRGEGMLANPRRSWQDRMIASGMATCCARKHSRILGKRCAALMRPRGSDAGGSSSVNRFRHQAGLVHRSDSGRSARKRWFIGRWSPGGVASCRFATPLGPATRE